MISKMGNLLKAGKKCKPGSSDENGKGFNGTSSQKGGNSQLSPASGESRYKPFPKIPVLKQAKALYDYMAPPDSPNDLSFKTGDVMDILNDSDHNWWFAVNVITKEKGNIPSNYFELVDETDKCIIQSMNQSNKLIGRENSNQSNNEQKTKFKPLPEPPNETETPSKQAKALYDYTAPRDSPDDMSFRVGDVMDILNDSDNDWWLAVNTRTGDRGYIPCNYVALIRGIEGFDWYHHNISRMDSDKLLKENRQNIIGTFLVRESETLKGTYTISILYLDDDGERKTKNYHIKNMDDNKGCYITPKAIFRTIPKLVEFYSNDEGLCVRLTRACPKMIPVTVDLSKTTRDKWEVDRKTIKKLDMLGSGNFGEVWKGTWNNTRPVAIKMMKPGTMEKSKFLEEAAVMKELRHPKLVRLYAVCTTEEPIYLILEYIVNGCLLKYLRNDGGKQLTILKLLDIAAQIANGMQYIESKGYIHRDLAARNVLVGQNNMVKIADFGLSKALLTDEIYQAKDYTKFPVKWTAIESIISRNFTIKSDVWSFGIVLVELITYGNIPYPGLTNYEVQALLQGSFRHPRPAECDEKLYEIMLECWHKDPQERPTFDYLFHTIDDYYVSTQNSYD